MTVKRMLFVFFLIATGLTTSYGASHDSSDTIAQILLTRRHRGDPSGSEELRAYASDNHVSNFELSAQLIEFVKTGMASGADERQTRLANSALWRLIDFGSSSDCDFVRDVMRTTPNRELRLSAIIVGIRMDPAHWEEWAREICSDGRFSSFERFVAFEEAYRIGIDSDEETQRCVEKVLSEFAERETDEDNKEHLLRWAGELKSR